jgi:1-acyl-sn-glycerol-3-phosphate acyltransferase
MTALRSLLFNICFITWAMGSAVLFTPLFVMSSRTSLKVGAPWARFSLLLARLICNIRYEVRGAHNIMNTPAIYASKHQSAWDTIIFLILLPYPAYVLKRELLRIPLWGWYLWRMQMIAIDRSAGGQGLKDMLKQAKARVTENRPIVIFPEGTRTPVGANPHYHPGVVALYSSLKLPVVPVALNSGCFWGRNAFTKRAGKVVIEFLPAIAPGMPKEAFLPALMSTIEPATAQLVAESKLSQE